MEKQVFERKKWEKEQQKRTAERQRTDLVQKREKLKDAYRRLAQQKREFNQYKTQVEKAIGGWNYWRGNQRNSFNSEYDAIVNENRTLYNQIDRILDDINMEVLAYDKEIHNKDILISGLTNQIRTLKTRIQNATN